MMHRLFVAGCSRSGTTVLTHFIANNYNLQSMIETRFFLSLLGKRRVFSKLNIETGYSQQSFNFVNQHYERNIFEKPKFPKQYIYNYWVAEFYDALDRLAKNSQKSGWIEKTPIHLNCMTDILALVPNSKALIIVRSGPEVVNSIITRAFDYPVKFRAQQDPDYGINLWNLSLAKAEKALQSRNAVLIDYDRFAKNPHKTLERALKIKATNSPSESTKSIVQLIDTYDNEPWKKKALLAPKVTERTKHPIYLKNKEYIINNLHQERYLKLLGYLNDA